MINELKKQATMYMVRANSSSVTPKRLFELRVGSLRDKIRTLSDRAWQMSDPVMMASCDIPSLYAQVQNTKKKLEKV